MRRLIGMVKNEREADPFMVEVAEHDLTGELGVYLSEEGKGDVAFIYKEEIVSLVDLLFKASNYIDFKKEDEQILYEKELKDE